MCTKTGIKDVYKGVQGVCLWNAGPALEAWLMMDINMCIWVMESVPHRDGDGH